MRPIQPIRFNFLFLITAGKFQLKSYIVLSFKLEGSSGSPQGQATVSYSKELEFQPFIHIGFFQRDHDKSSGVTFGQFGASYSVKNLDSI